MRRTTSQKFTSAAAACLLVFGSFNATAAPIAPTGDGGGVTSGRLTGLRAAIAANSGALAALANGDVASARGNVVRTLALLRAVVADCAKDAGLAKLGTFVGEIVGALERIEAGLATGVGGRADLERVEQDLVTALSFAR